MGLRLAEVRGPLRLSSENAASEATVFNRVNEVIFLHPSEDGSVANYFDVEFIRSSWFSLDEGEKLLDGLLAGNKINSFHLDFRHHSANSSKSWFQGVGWEMKRIFIFDKWSKVGKKRVGGGGSSPGCWRTYQYN
jgi:hypothetical protein